MFMQAGLRDRRDRPVPREERQPHHDDELHGVRRRHAGLLAHRLRASRWAAWAPSRTWAARRRSNGEYIDPPLRRRPWACSDSNGFFLTHDGTYDVGVMVMFLFQMVFMDTALTIVTGTCAERWKFAAFVGLLVRHGRVHLSAVRQLGVGRRLARDARRQLRAGPRLRRLRRIRRRARRRRHHRAGDRHASSARASASTPATASRTRSPAHDIVDRADRLLHPGVRMVRLQSRIARLAPRATATCASARSRSTRCSRA